MVGIGILYGVINCLYSLLATIIYPPIDWTSLLSYILMTVAYLLGVLMFFLGNLVFRKWKYPKIKRNSILLEVEEE